jgi:hypothetical protein
LLFKDYYYYFPKVTSSNSVPSKNGAIFLPR